MKRPGPAPRRLLLLIGALALALGVAACGSDESNGSAGSADSDASATVNADGTLTILMKDNVFEPKQFTAAASQSTTVTLENKGAALHNMEFIKENGPDGKPIGTQPQFVPGGQKGTLTFTLPAGEYEFWCSVHPVEMKGTVTVR